MSRKALFPSGQENRTGGPSTRNGSWNRSDLCFPQWLEDACASPSLLKLLPGACPLPGKRIVNSISATLRNRFLPAKQSGCVETTSNASHRKEHHPNGVQAVQEPTFFGVYCQSFDFPQFPDARPLASFAEIAPSFDFTQFPENRHGLALFSSRNPRTLPHQPLCRNCFRQFRAGARPSGDRPRRAGRRLARPW